MTQTEALKLALEALKFFKELSLSIKEIERAEEVITAIKEALMSQSDGAQPAVPQGHKQSTTCGEPVAWMEGESVYWHTNPSLNDWIRANGTPLYTTPPQRTWVGLTDEERDECWDMLLGTNEFNREGITKTIEAALKEKNA